MPNPRAFTMFKNLNMYYIVCITKNTTFCQLIFRLTPLTSADKKYLFLVFQNYALLSYLEWPLQGTLFGKKEIWVDIFM